jgi:hypothetical protein
MSGSWYMPLDPACPNVADFYENVLDDPMVAYASIGEELTADFEAKHRSNCTRCQEFGAANIDVSY